MAMATLKDKNKLKDYEDYEVEEAPVQKVDTNSAKLVTKQKDYTPADTVAETEKFTYDKAPAYASKYQSQIDDLMDSLLNREQFTYNPEEDETYLQYKDSYTRAGQRAQQDTLGQIAARTGGLASSYATSASQQAYNNYMSALADKIPELKQLAYAMYQDEINNKRSDLSVLMTADQNEYSRFLNELNQYNADRNFDYGLYRDDIADKRYDTEWDYGLSRDQLEDEWRNKQWDYQLEQDQYAKDIYDKEYGDNMELNKANLLATYGDFSAIQELYGLTDEQVKGLKYEWNRQMKASQSKSSSKVAETVGSRTGYTKKELVKALEEGSTSQALFDDYYDMTGERYEGDPKKKIIDTDDSGVENLGYGSAINYMLENGVPNEDVKNLMPENVWQGMKSNLMNSGKDYSIAYPELNNETYTDYLKDYILGVTGIEL